MSFTNLYYKRTAGTARPCYICCKPTTTVLATINTADFLYTCPVHLTDRGFATPTGEAGGSTQKPELSPGEIAKVREEWEKKQRRKTEKKMGEKGEVNEKVNEKDKEKENKEKGQDTSNDRLREEQGKKVQSKPASHEQYSLHRDYFSMRLAEHRKQKHAAQVKELAPRLPKTPHSMPK